MLRVLHLPQGAELRPVFVLDPWFVKNAKVGPNRWRFLAQTLADLDAGLRKLKSRCVLWGCVSHAPRGMGWEGGAEGGKMSSEGKDDEQAA